MAIKLIFMGLKLHICWSPATEAKREILSLVVSCTWLWNDAKKSLNSSLHKKKYLFTISNPIEVDYHCWTLIDIRLKLKREERKITKKNRAFADVRQILSTKQWKQLRRKSCAIFTRRRVR